MTSFSQNVTVKKIWLDNAIEELRTKDIWAERLSGNKKTIDSLETAIKVANQRTAGETMKANSFASEAQQWKTIAQNNERLWKADRAKKRRRGWIIGTAIAAAVAKGTYDIYRKLK